jgi:hypothetical protein
MANNFTKIAGQFLLDCQQIPNSPFGLGKKHSNEPVAHRTIRAKTAGRDFALRNNQIAQGIR